MPGPYVKIIILMPGQVHRVSPAHWRGTLVVVERGLLEVVTTQARHRFASGAAVTFALPGLRTVGNPGPGVAVLRTQSRSG